MNAPINVACPRCGAPPGTPCYRRGLPRGSYTHERRRGAAQLQSAAERREQETPMANLVNLTPHPVTLVVGDQQVTLAPSGQVARVAASTQAAGAVRVGEMVVPLVFGTYGAVTGLPEVPVAGVLYVVSGMVRAALPGRTDLVSPADVVRDGEGRVVGARALECNR